MKTYYKKSGSMLCILKKYAGAAMLFLMLLSAIPVSCASEETPSAQEVTARPSVNGRLHVDGSSLVDESGKQVRLRGVSTHGLTWFPKFIDETLFSEISEDWNCNLIRLAMYSDIYCGGQKEESLSLVKKGIEAAISADMYVIADWHILEDSDPNQNKEAAAEFFDLISSQYAGCPNLIFEICNEPNGDTGWSDITEYCDEIIPVIRKNIPEAVILAGTPEYDRNLSAAVLRPLHFENVMYVLHFYAASHGEGLRQELKTAVDSGLPVFVSECGISEDSGTGTLDFSSAVSWFECLNENGISYAVWNLSDKDEASAFFKSGFDPAKGIDDRDLTLSGQWVRELIRGMNPGEIPAAAQVVEPEVKQLIESWITNSLGERGYNAVSKWLLLAAAALLIFLAGLLISAIYIKKTGNRKTYDSIYENNKKTPGTKNIWGQIALVLSLIFTLIYLGWRIVFSVPVESGAAAVLFNLLLFAVEAFGFAESVVLFVNLMGMRDHPLPDIPADRYPDVDIFIATYNEPTELLRKTVNGCRHLKYPDLSKVHIWICDDNRRTAMHELADEMGVGYFDRPDNKGAKAGNLNHALSLTSAPYIVTLDADMIPKSDFLLKTIPYFVDFEMENEKLPEEERCHLGLLQTPQCFYDPDVFQHALYSEKRVPNEQDFFYRTIEPAKTSTNSVIYGGSNTVLSRKALGDCGGFYTESITEDFATGLLIESKGYVSLALPEPLASGQTPHTFREHIKQRTRWGRGVIVTARKLKIWKLPGLSFLQKISYWSSVVYWYSPVKNMIYMISPLVFATFALPVFRCNWLELLVYWLPMFILQDTSLRVNSRKKISLKWSGIYETSVMPHLLVPIIKEFLGISLSQFNVTDKSKKSTVRKKDVKAMVPFLMLIGFSAAGIVRLILTFEKGQLVSFLILLFWIVRNIYFLILSVFLVDGRDSDGEEVTVNDAEPVVIETEQGEGAFIYEGVTTRMTEHNLTVFLDGDEKPAIGTHVGIGIHSDDYHVHMKGVVTGVKESRGKQANTQTIEILDFCGAKYEYLSILYDRVPTLPQTLSRDLGIIRHLWQNIAQRVARTIR